MKGLLLFLFFWWSSTALALSNSIRSSKSCYITGEAFVVSFTVPNPKVHDWVGILKASDSPTGSNVQYPQFVYTCGTANCSSTAPVSGTVSIYNGLPTGKYKAVLLRSDTFQPLAVTANFTVAATCPGPGGPPPTSNAISIGKACYNTGEGILATFTEINPKVGDKVGLIQSSANVNGANVFYPAAILTCGTPTCSFAPTKGSVSLFTRLSVGQYKAVLLKGSPLTPLAVSSNFVIAKVCGPVLPTAPSPPTRPPTLAPVRPTAPVARSSIAVSRSCYKSRQLVVVSFVDVGAQPGDRVGLANATLDVTSNNRVYPIAIFTCGSSNCTTAPPSGRLSIFQNLAPGKYKAVLLRGKQLIPLAVSAIFRIASVCPGPAPTPAPGHSVSVSKSCYLSAESVIATFTDSDAQSGDKVGLIQASVDVELLPITYLGVILTCGTFTCTGAPKSGMVSLYQQYSTGQYKAVLLRGKGLTALAVSSKFNVSTRCN